MGTKSAAGDVKGARRPSPAAPARSAPAIAGSGHIRALDGLRGVAIGLVLIYHFTLGMQGQGLAGRLLLKLASIGWCGVDLFFVLSGFLITGILCDARQSRHRFRNFYSRRALRIFPLYFGVLAAVFVGVHVFPSTHGMRAELEEARLWLWCYGANILVAIRDSWFPLSHFWSLAVEEHFYIFWPAVILGCDRKTAVRVCGTLIVAALLVRLWMVNAGAVLAAYCLTICRIDALAIGGLIALAARSSGGLDAVVARGHKMMVGSVLALVVLAVARKGLLLHDPAIQIGGYLLLDLVFAFLLVRAVTSPDHGRLSEALAARPLRWLGRYAYGIYVYNSIYLLVAERSLLMPRLVTASGPVAGRLAYMLLLAGSTLGTAWLSWHLLEKHCLKLKRYFPMDGCAAGHSHIATCHGMKRACAVP